MYSIQHGNEDDGDGYIIEYEKMEIFSQVKKD